MSRFGHRPILADAAAEQALSAQGYAVLPLLGAAPAQQLLADLRQLVPAFPEGFYASVHGVDASLRAAVNALLMQRFRPLLAEVSLDATLLGGAFINKAPGARGALPPHQDWNIVDESLHRSFNVWLPLVDTDVANGAIQVLPGSHLWQPTLRGPNIPCVYRQVHARLHAAMRLLPLRAGEVLIYNHRLLHCSGLNTSSADRPGAVMGLVPAHALLRHYFGDQGEVRRYHSSVDFLLGGQTHLRPVGLREDATLAYDSTPLVDEQLEQFLHPEGAVNAATH